MLTVRHCAWPWPALYKAIPSDQTLSKRFLVSRVIFWNGIKNDSACGILRTLTVLMRMQSKIFTCKCGVVVQ